jgi:Cu/Ag efflux pump CusA
LGERLLSAAEKLPPGLQPRLAPISTALGEIFYYTVEFKRDATNKPSTRYGQLQELKQIQEYVVSPLLRATPGVAEVNLPAEKVPEIEGLFANIGTAEIAIDPMGPNVCDTYIELKPRGQWRKMDGRPATKEQLIELMRRELLVKVPGQALLFTQPIQMRFNEMMAGVRADIAVKVYGDDFKELECIATEIRDVLRRIPGLHLR